MLKHEQWDEAGPKERETLLRALLDQSDDGIVAFDREHRCIFCNSTMERMSGKPKSELLGRKLQEVFPFSRATEAELGRALAGEGFVAAAGRFDPGGAAPMMCDLHYSSLRDAEGRVVAGVAVVRDVTQKREAEHRAIEPLILEHREEVQMRIGQDLHDGLGQLLTGIAFLAKGLEPSVASQNGPQMARLIDLINQAIGQVRALAKGLSPLHLDKRNLAAVLEDLVSDSSATTGVHCRFSDEGGADARSLNDKTQLYMIAREAITNAFKHAQPKEIQVAIARVGDHCEMTIRDDGCGLPAVIPLAGFGVRSMHYRAHMLGGFLELRRGEPAGTLVRCVWPADQPTDA